jgi:hypothetical protein
VRRRLVALHYSYLKLLRTSHIDQLSALQNLLSSRDLFLKLINAGLNSLKRCENRAPFIVGQSVSSRIARLYPVRVSLDREIAGSPSLFVSSAERMGYLCVYSATASCQAPQVSLL